LSVAYWAILVNAWLNKRRDNRAQRDERKAVLAALFGEIVMLRCSLAEVARIVAGIESQRALSSRAVFDTHFLKRAELPEATLYPALASRIGILDVPTIVEVARLYAHYYEVKKWLPLLREDKDRRYSYSPTYVLRPARDAIKGIVPTLERIGVSIGASEVTEKLSLGLTEDIIEMEEIRAEESDVR